MNLKFNLIPEKVEELSKIFLILSNIKRIRLLLLIHKINPSSSADIHRLAKKEGLYNNRETTYRSLEVLVKTKLVSKFYDEEKKELVYFIKNKK